MGEQTSLARQLQKLAAPQTTILLSDKKRASLIYNPQDATSIDKDVFFAHGSTGLDKLILVEPRFGIFQQTLFSESSRTLERSVQSKDVNKELDATIADFLRMLSPYFRLPGAVQALEWLIHRFHIHLFNVDDLIACALPFHETEEFNNVVDLLDLRNPSGRWCWLKPIQDARISLEASVIVKRVNSNGGFRKFVCNLVPNILKVYGAGKESVALPVISFSTLTIYHALQVSKHITDNVIAILLPYIVGGLRSDISSYCSGAYMILSAVLMREKLAPTMLKDLLIRVVQCPLPSLQKQSLELILLMYQQQDIKNFPKKALSSLCDSKGVVSHLKYLLETYRCTKFWQCFVKRAVPSAYKKELLRTKSSKPGKTLAFFLNVINSFTLQESDVALCLKLILNWYTKLNRKFRTKVKRVSTLKKVGKSLLKCLELRCAEHFDSAVEMYFKKKSSRQKKCARTLLNDSVTSLRHELLPDSSMTIFLGINHPVASVRTCAISALLKELSANTVSDTKFVEDALISRLSDDCPDVLLLILKSEKVLFNFLPKEQLFTSLNSVLQKSHEQMNEDWHSVKSKALKVMCKLWKLCAEPELQASIVSVILPFLLPLQSESLEYLSCVLNSALGSKHPLFSAVKEGCMASITNAKDNRQKFKDVFCAVMKSLLASVEGLDGSTKYEIVSILVKNLPDMKLDCCYSFILTFLLQQLVVVEDNACQQMEWAHYAIELFSSYLDSNMVLFTNKKLPTDIDEVIKTSVKVLRKKKFPISVMSFGLQAIIKSLKIKCFSAELLWWPDTEVESEISSSYTVTCDLFHFLTKYMNNTTGQDNAVFKMMFGTLIQTHLPDLRKIFWFLASMWSGYAKSNLAIQIISIKMAEAFCILPSPPFTWIWEESSVVLPALLVTIASYNQQVRTMALKLLEKILLQQDGSQPLQKFASNICKHAKEIGMDSNQLFQVVGHWLSPAVQNSSSDHDQPTDESTVLKWLQHLIQEESTPKVIKLNTLLMLQSVNSKEVLSPLLPVLKKYLVQYKERETDAVETATIQQLLMKFTVETASLLENEASEAFVVLSMALQLIVQRENSLDTVVHEMALKQVTKSFFIAIPNASVQQKILGMLVDLYLSSVSSERTSKINRTLEKLCVYASQLLKVLHGFECAAPKKTVKEMRMSRTQHPSTSSDADFLENGPWKKTLVILEIIQNKKKIKETEILIPELFNVLSKTLEWENQLSVEYFRQLVLASIFNCCDQLSIGDLDERKFQVELIVQCIRVSDSPKTHNQALLLLNLAATMFPDYVLNNIMSIFTFMGSSIIRQDDGYSFQVITQTIETIVPALLQASRQQKENDSLQVIATVIRVFVDSLLHIPSHRQLPLFTKLITTLGPSEYLWVPLAQICGNYVSKESSVAAVKKGFMDIENNPLLEFSFNLYQLFAPRNQVRACTDLVKFLLTLPDRRGEKDVNKLSKEGFGSAPKEPFDVAIHSELQLQVYKFTVLQIVNTLLSSQIFIGQVAELEEKYHRKMEEQYRTLFEIVLQFLKHVSQVDYPDGGELWKEITIILYDLLNTVNALLPCGQFISFVLSLLKNETSLVRHKTLEMLNAKLEHQPSFFSVDNYCLLLKLLRPLLKIVWKNTSSNNNTFDVKESDDVQSQQSALLSLHLICKIAGDQYPAKFEKVLHVVVKVLSSDSSHFALVVNALMCLAQLCKCLKAHVLPQLNTFMPKIVCLLEQSNAVDRNEYLVLGVVTVLQGLVEYLGVFLSGFMEPIITHVSALASEFTEEKGKMADLQVKLQKLMGLISAEIPLRVLLPAIFNSYEQIKENKKTAVSSLMVILREGIANMNLTDLFAHHSEMEKFYILAMDFRAENPLEPLPVVEKVEESIIASVMKLVLKLSETSFVHFFSSIQHWVKKSPEKFNKDKVFTFYRLTHEFALTLKNLFVRYAGMFAHHAGMVLDANNTSKSEKPYFGRNHTATVKSTQLLNHILDTFSNCFHHDNKELVDKDFFSTFMQPLVDQIENEQGGDEVYKERIEEHLSPCISHFATSTTDSALWKQLNYQILLKTKNSSPKVRFAALQVLLDVVKKMDTEYLTLLPESLPLLAELMEDESFEVEKQCQTVVAEMSEILGEPLDKYF